MTIAYCLQLVFYRSDGCKKLLFTIPLQTAPHSATPAPFTAGLHRPGDQVHCSALHCTALPNTPQTSLLQTFQSGYVAPPPSFSYG
jgi:hypothetical protein